MATIPEFKIPSFLNDQDAETIHQRMMEKLPADIDDTEGGFPWDFTKPTALEKAEMLEFHLVETLKLMFPAWSYGEWLDLHASGKSMERKPANQATGVVRVSGVPGTTIPEGFKFATPSIDGKPAVEFEAIEKYNIGEEGAVDVEIRAVTAGVIGNVPADTISLMMTPIKGITAISNELQTSGGAEEESDEELRARIDERDAAGEASFVGSDSDYKRWAEEVPGVGTALVAAEWDGPGTVKVIIIDANGEPGNQTMITAVYNNIISPDDRVERKAPIGATVTVTAPDPKEINYSFILELEAGEAIGIVINRFKEELQAYYSEAKAESVIRYTRVSSILTSTPGVRDFSDLKINGSIGNIGLDEDEYPITGNIDPGGAS